jgi:hypothetical protein
MNEQLKKLADDAEVTAKIQQHDLGIWRILADGRAAHAYCNRCKGEAYITTIPMGDDYAISGPAVMLNCKGTELEKNAVVIGS